MTQKNSITGKSTHQIASHNQNVQTAIKEANKKRQSNRFKKNYVHVKWEDESEFCLVWNEDKKTHEVAHLAYAYHSPDEPEIQSRSTNHREVLRIMNS